MNKHQEIKKFLTEVDAHPEWGRIELSSERKKCEL